MVVTIPETRSTPEIEDSSDHNNVAPATGDCEEEDSDEDRDDSDIELEHLRTTSNESDGQGSTRARTHVITRSRSTSDLYVCDLEQDPVSEILDDSVVPDQEPERVQSNPEPDSTGIILSSTASLKSVRGGRTSRMRSTLPLYYDQRAGSVTLKDDPYHNLLQTSAEKVLNKLKSRQLILSQEQLHYRRNSSRPHVMNSVPRKLKPLFSGDEHKRASVNEDMDVEPS